MLPLAEEACLLRAARAEEAVAANDDAVGWRLLEICAERSDSPYLQVCSRTGRHEGDSSSFGAQDRRTALRTVGGEPG